MTPAQAALNSTPSVASCGLYGPQDSKLWALSQIESLHLWEWAAAVDEEVPGETTKLPLMHMKTSGGNFPPSASIQCSLEE